MHVDNCHAPKSALQEGFLWHKAQGESPVSRMLTAPVLQLNLM